MRIAVGRTATTFAGLVLAGSLVACGGSGAAETAEPTRPAATVTSTPSADTAKVAAANAAVTKPLAALQAAQQALNANYRWVSAAAGKEAGDDPAQQLFWRNYLRSISGARASASGAVRRAREGAQANPRVCSAVAENKAIISRALSTARIENQKLQAATAGALAQLGQVPPRRAAVEKALAALLAAHAANPESTVPIEHAATLARAHSVAEEKQLRATIERSKAAAAEDLRQVERIANNAAGIGRPCG